MPIAFFDLLVLQDELDQRLNRARNLPGPSDGPPIGRVKAQLLGYPSMVPKHLAEGFDMLCVHESNHRTICSEMQRIYSSFCSEFSLGKDSTMDYGPERFQELVIEKIEERAFSCGINFSELGRRADLTSTPIETLKQIRKGKQRLNMEHFVKIANALGTEPSYLLYLAERAYADEQKSALALAAEEPATYDDNGDDDVGNAANG